MLPQRHNDRDKMEELCCLYALGELSIDERNLLIAHLAECERCRELVRDFEQISLIDLSGVAAAEGDKQLSEEIEKVEVDRLLGQVVELAHKEQDAAPSDPGFTSLPVPVCRVSRWDRASRYVKRSLPAAGWSVAALILIGVLLPKLRNIQTQNVDRDSRIAQHRQEVSQGVLSAAQLESWKSRSATAEARLETATQALERERAQALASADSLAKAKATYAELVSKRTALEKQLEAQNQKSQDQLAELSSVRADLEEERDRESTLRAQLQDVSSRLQTQRAEVAHLQSVAANVPVRMPVTEHDPTAAEANELFGARDLHIVDVYDVDHSGKASRTYGRVYYVNHRLLLFYAFDLADKEKGRKAGGFQAWGFRQPDSTTPENLGLFYIDDAKLDRWVLRVSDPKILSRIDTVFVTIEPPGGSATPKGRQLLLASLAGPPNHP